MASTAPSLRASAAAGNEPAPARILRQARALFFAQGYTRFTMEELASDLGMSKKTLYVHFAGKDEIIAAVIQDLGRETRADADALLRKRELNFTQKLNGFVQGMVERLSPLDARTIRDLQRFAPALFELVEDVRRKHLPYIFGRLVEEGQHAGLVRTDLPASFALEFFLHGMQGTMHPATLERLRLAPRDVVAAAIDLFFGGLLTPAGRKQHEKLFPR